MDIFFNGRIQIYLNNTLNLPPLTPYIIPCYTQKWRSYRDHRLCDVTLPYVSARSDFTDWSNQLDFKLIKTKISNQNFLSPTENLSIAVCICTPGKQTDDGVVMRPWPPAVGAQCKQVCVEPPPSALNTTLPACAAERRCLQHGARS